MEKTGITLFLSALIVVGGIFSYSKFTTRGEITSDLVIAKYLQALKKSDRKKILRLLPKNYDADAEIVDKLKLYGGKELRNLTVQSKDNGVSSSFLYVTITGVIDEQGKEMPFEDHITVQSPSEHWYLVMGKYVGKDSVANIKPTEAR